MAVKAPPKRPVNPKKREGLNTFEGVFTPSILTILGVIMYLRFGWVVGNVGLAGTLLIVTISTSITFLTSLSIASIATDQRVRTGGAYYMISRSLGIETGGAVGIPLYIAQTLSIALYTIGFAESFSTVFPQFDQRLIGVVVTLLIGTLALFSARVAIRSQFFIMAAIVISLISLVFGSAVEETKIEMWGAADRHSESFWIVFAVFFPAVTGIMAGVNMSGDLKNAARSIPKGTFAAVGTGYVIYMVLPVILAMRADALTLIEDPLIMRKIAVWGDAILLGVWGATLSSAMGSILGAPRVLQALVKDGVLPSKFRFLGKGHGSEDNPRVGTIFTVIIALFAVVFGNLNIVAPILTMFFLTTYGVLNISAGLEQFLKSPSFRPKFKVHWLFSLAGAVGCIAVMLLINPLATAAAAVFIIVIYFWLERRGLEAAWGDVRQGIWMAMIRAGLLRIEGNLNAKNWRPHILVLSGAPTRRWYLVTLASSITQNRALMTVCTILPANEVTAKRRRSMEKNLDDYLHNRGISGLVRVFPAADPFTGAKQIVDMYGLGKVMPNTVMLGDSGLDELDPYADMVRHFYQSERNVLVIRNNDELKFGNRKRIDIWWGGLKKNGGLMIILGYLLQNSNEWRNATVNLYMSVPSEKAAEGAEENLQSLINEMRINVNFKVLVLQEGQTFFNMLHQESKDADLLFLGLAVPAPNMNWANYYRELREKTTGLPTTVYVLASQDIAFRNVLS